MNANSSKKRKKETIFHKVNGTLNWVIRDFEERVIFLESLRTILSPCFIFPVFDIEKNEQRDIRFQLKIYPKGHPKFPSDVGLFVHSEEAEKLKVKFTLGILKNDGSIWNFIGPYFFEFKNGNGYGSDHAFSLHDFSLSKSELLLTGSLSVFCEFTIFSEKFRAIPETEAELETLPNLNDHMHELFRNALFSDVNLCCEGKVFPCHKNILAARSDVFRAMFECNEMIEGKTNTVQIEDIDPGALEQLLQFIYTEKVNGLNNAQKVLYAANKYNIQKLKLLCENSLSQCINTGNALEFLELAYLHDGKILKKTSIEFVAQNLTKLRKSSEWKAVVDHFPKILEEILAAVTEDGK